LITGFAASIGIALGPEFRLPFAAPRRVRSGMAVSNDEGEALTVT